MPLTLTKGKAGPGAKGSFSCSIWYLRYSSTPFCSNTFCSRSVRNKTREETAMVTAFSGFGCRKRDMIGSALIKLNSRNREMSGQEWPIEKMPGKHRRRSDEGFERNGSIFLWWKTDLNLNPANNTLPLYKCMDMQMLRLLFHRRRMGQGH